MKNLRKKNYNNSVKSKIKTLIKKFNININEKKTELANKNIKIIQSFIDKKSKKNIINKNKSSRIKSKLMKKLNLIL